jgi:hypothetical protein
MASISRAEESLLKKNITDEKDERPTVLLWKDATVKSSEGNIRNGRDV